jgi:pyruvate dehydrogenase E2 component (dihydrolipoamide acetyltransferase)
MTTVADSLARLAPLPESEFSAFGPIETVQLTRYQQLTGAFLGRNWVTIPHVTHHDEVDIGLLGDRRTEWEQAHPGMRLTPVAVLIKALAGALRLFPNFNSSLSNDGRSLILKGYFNIGVAVDTPKGLLVPVLRSCDTKSLAEVATELAAISETARTKGLSMAQMSGSSMAVSSLGHIGGTAFTPIINAPDVAILGVMRSRETPHRGPGGEIVWRTMLPLSLSYDHRVINGAEAARFVKATGELLKDETILA